MNKTETIVKPATPEAIREAAKILREGGLVGMPTETVYGLGANALDSAAVLRIFEAKGRPADNPLIVHVSCVEEIPPLVREIPQAARRLMEAYWPGPMTLILPKADCIPAEVSAGLDTVGIRLPASETARALIREAGCPIAAPSANRSGKPSPTTAQHVYEDMNGRIPMILDGGACEVGVESSVIDATGEIPVILRPGGITPEMVEAACGAVRVDEHVMSPLAEGDIVRSPGMKYKHYAPTARTIIYEGEREHVIAAICARYDQAAAAGERVAILGFDEHDFGGRTRISLGSAENPQDAAARLFAALRELDEMGETMALCEAVGLEGIGLAVMNRMGRAAAFDIRRV
ncbi:MAG: threonylcarbamoyl-AMP synthase [Clostridia bacterium]|nr:threonylcarbamoyl-AMP synthase [Clostridia bacterium]